MLDLQDALIQFITNYRAVRRREVTRASAIASAMAMSMKYRRDSL
jgi:hypothetical protein